jgi:hypothetical protein
MINNMASQIHNLTHFLAVLTHYVCLLTDESIIFNNVKEGIGSILFLYTMKLYIW